MSEIFTTSPEIYIIPDGEELDFHAGEEIRQLEEYFKQAIPKLLEYIRSNGITHILLLEKTARLLKTPLMTVFRRMGLGVKVGSYAGDYFQSVDFSGSRKKEFLYEKQLQNRKLNFLPDKDEDYQILVLDEYICTGFGLEKAIAGLKEIGFNTDNIHSLGLDSTRGMGGLHQTGVLEKILYNAVSDKIFNPFLPDGTQKQVFYPRLNPEHLFSYRELVQRLTNIILISSQK